MPIRRLLKHIVLSAVGSAVLILKMSGPPPNQRSDATGRESPTAEQIDHVARAIESYASQRKTADADNSSQNSKIHWWARASAIAVVIYTLITIGVFVASIRSNQETRRAAHYAGESARVAIEQARITQQNFRMDQ